MKRLILSILAIVATFGIVACNSPTSPSSTEPSSLQQQSSESSTVSRTQQPEESSTIQQSRALLEGKILQKSAANEDLYHFTCADFDNDGTDEAFAILAKREDDTLLGHIWFADDSGAFALNAPVEDVECDFFRDEAVVFPEGDLNFIAFAGAYATASPTLLFGVEGGKPYQVPISGDVLHKSGAGYVIQQNTLDAAQMDGSLIGRSIKPYWLYFDNETERFHEYTAKEITESDILAYIGGKKALETIENVGGDITNILLRDNNKLHINYITNSYKDEQGEGYENHYYTFDIVGTRLTGGENSNDGIYLPYLYPNLDNYRFVELRSTN